MEFPRKREQGANLSVYDPREEARTLNRRDCRTELNHRQPFAPSQASPAGPPEALKELEKMKINTDALWMLLIFACAVFCYGMYEAKKQESRRKANKINKLSEKYINWDALKK